MHYRERERIGEKGGLYRDEVKPYSSYWAGHWGYRPLCVCALTYRMKRERLRALYILIASSIPRSLMISYTFAS